MTTTQYVLIGVFLFFAVVAVIIFAGFGGPGGGGGNDVTVATIWGSIPSDSFNMAVDGANAEFSNTLNITYEEYPENIFLNELVNAIAEGRGPDIALIPQTLLFVAQNKLAEIPFSILSERVFKDSFIEGGEVFRSANGFLAVPFLVDPLVMYWNRDMFANSGISRPPTSWEEVLSISSTLTKKDNDRFISKSAVALGEYQNVVNAKEILSTLAMQAGSPIVSRNQEFLPMSAVFESKNPNISNPFDSAVSFFMQFSDPQKPIYSWNKSFADSQTEFVRGNLAIYFGFASELPLLKQKNPNLNFDVARIPQATSITRESTYAKIYGLAILTSSKDQNSAFDAVSKLINKGAITTLYKFTNLPPVRRDLLETLPGTGFGDVFWKSALISRSWLEPAPEKTSFVFRNLIDSIGTGRSKTSEAIRLFSGQLEEAFN